VAEHAYALEAKAWHPLFNYSTHGRRRRGQLQKWGPENLAPISRDQF